MAKQRTATLSYQGGQPNTRSEPMDITAFSRNEVLADQFLVPFADPTYHYSTGTFASGGASWICTRTYKVTGIWLACNTPAADIFAIFEIYVNGVASGVSLQIPNGQIAAHSTGSLLNLSAGDEVAIHLDASSTTVFDSLACNIHLDPN